MRYFKRNINKIVLISLLLIFVTSLASCRTSPSTWYSKSYTTWAADFSFLSDDGSFSFWQALLGWPISLLSYPFAWMMHGIGTLCGSSFFWGLLFTTLIVRTIGWPIYAKTNGMQVKLQEIQPEMQKIQAKYAGRTDPESRQRQSQETMKLYKRYKMNPLGCVLPMLIQLPIFMSMYECVRRIQTDTVVYSSNGVLESTSSGVFALSNTKLFGYFEINASVFSSSSYGVTQASTTHDIVFGIVIAIIVGITMFVSQKLAQRKPKWQKKRIQVNTQQQEQQKKTMRIMSVVMAGMFVFICLSSTALGIYYLIANIYQVIQSQIVRKRNEKKYYKMKEQSNLIINK